MESRTGGASSVKRPHLESRTELTEVAENLLVGVCLPFLLTLGRRLARDDGIPDVLSELPHHHLLLLL